MTTPLSDAEPFDEQLLGAWLEANVEGFQRPFTLTRLPASRSNPTYRLRAASADYVLRRKPFGKLPPSTHAIDREYRLLGALYPLDFPVPQPLAVCEDNSVIGAAFYVMELALGRSWEDGALPDFDPATRTRMYAQLTDTLADLHSIDPDAVGLGDFGKGEKHLEREVARCTRQYRDSETSYLPEMERLIAFLPQTLPSQARSTIVHGDYRIGNALFDGDGTLTAVLDWEMATLGDPLADFSCFALQWVLAADGAAAIGGLDHRALGIPSLKAVAARYGERSGVPVPAKLDWYFAFHLFRSAATVQGTKTQAAEATAMAERVPLLAKAAWTFAKRAGA